jgi:N-acetylglucosaminyldiphosphoundecaprenol N-acetyl-beta-D-mannosaminyltransferase
LTLAAAKLAFEADQQLVPSCGQVLAPSGEHVQVNGCARPNESTREIYGVLGMPIDATNMRTVVRHIASAAASASPLFISTLNVNFLTYSRRDSEFRASLIDSDLCTADGMPIVWLSRLLGIPLKERIAGADLFDTLNCVPGGEPLKAFLFGGAEGVAEKAAQRLNAQKGGVVCTGWHCPGFGGVEEMSSDEIIDKINASGADCLVVALGAHKGHLWLQRNQHKLKIPIRAQLGATINFQAGTIRRAPRVMQKCGLEWLWRIKEEPRLWRRYFIDGVILGRLMLTQVVPLALLMRWQNLRWRNDHEIAIARSEDAHRVTLTVTGIAANGNGEKAARSLSQAAEAAKDVVIHLGGTRQVDARFMGSLLLLQKRLKETGRSLTLTAVPRPVERVFRLNGFTFLLPESNRLSVA